MGVKSRELASAYIDEVLDDCSKWPNFELLERSQISIAGFSGEQVIYVNDTLLPFPSSIEDGRPLEIVRAVYFNEGDSLWIIEAKSEMEMADQVKADFEHILETFQILD